MTSDLRRRLGPLVAACIADLVAAVSHAAEGAHDHPHAPGLGDLLFPVINFTIFTAIVVRFVVPALREYLRGRAADAAVAAREAGARMRTAEEAMARARSRRTGLDAECASIRSDLVALALKQGEHTRVQAEESARRRVADAALVAEQERRRALGALRAEIAALATMHAEKRIRASLSPEDQRAFVRRMLRDSAAQ